MHCSLHYLYIVFRITIQQLRAAASPKQGHQSCQINLGGFRKWILLQRLPRAADQAAQIETLKKKINFSSLK
jgi:hypothetical protein